MERAVEERFERIEAITAGHAEIVAGHDQMLAKHEQMMAKHEQMMAKHEQMMAKHEQMMAEHAAGLTAHKLAVANLDDLLTKLAAAQIVTEQKLQGLIDALRRSGNGHN